MVSAPTLTRYFTLHFIFPFILSTLALIHLSSMHVINNQSSSVLILVEPIKLQFMLIKDQLIQFIIYLAVLITFY